MNTRTVDQLVDDLAGIVCNFNGREYSGDIGLETQFFGDLGMVSIDAVILSETLEQHYGQQFPFQRFLSELGQRGARDVTIGELAEFLHQHLE
jgi:acyl carrier protein